MSIFDEIDELQEQITSYSITDQQELEEFRLAFLSRKGKIQAMFKKIGEVPEDQRADVGKAMNEVKNLAQQKFENCKTELEQPDIGDEKAEEDLTLPPPPLSVGSLHPLTQIMEEMKEIFLRLGFSVAYGPELEDDFHNFTALNFPPDHPARDMQDTFFIRKTRAEDDEQDLVMRTHTSPVQIRLMQEEEPPIRAIMPGRVYRNEAITAKSFCLFYQLEALYVDRDVSLAELKETLITFARLMYGDDVEYRLRPSYFPFTEPSLEMDIWWDTGDSGQWLEILGAGMVDPNVFDNSGIDSDEYTGYAIGLGVDRIAMLRHGIDDIRLLYNNDLRFLNQFV